MCILANLFTMKILYIIPRFTAGGAEQLVWQYAGYFQKQGHEVMVTSTVGGGEWEEKFKKQGIEIFVNQKTGIWNWWGNYQNIKKIKKEFQPDIIHTHVFSADFFGYFLHQGVKWISTQHNGSKEFSNLRIKILRWILPHADKVIAVSTGVEEFCLEDLKLKKSKVQKVLNGIETEKWLSIPNNDLFTSDKMRLGIIGRLEEQKGHKYLWQALASLSFPWVLNIYGEGSEKTKLQSLAGDLKIADKIVWQGVKDSYSEINNLDVLIQPSLWEGLSLVVMEAMAAGRIVIASDKAGQDLIDDKKNGFVVPSGESVILADDIKYIWENKNTMLGISENARSKARGFDLIENIKKIEEIYKMTNN